METRPRGRRRRRRTFTGGRARGLRLRAPEPRPAPATPTTASGVLSVAAFDEAGNRGPVTSRFFKLNKFIPYTAINVVDTQQDVFGRVGIVIHGRGFTARGQINHIYLDRDGAAPFDYDFTTGFHVASDRLIDGIRLDNLAEGVYRVGVNHPERGKLFTGLVLKVEASGTVKVGGVSADSIKQRRWDFFDGVTVFFSVHAVYFWGVMLLLAMAGFGSSRLLAVAWTERLRLDRQAAFLFSDKSDKWARRAGRAIMRTKGLSLSIKFAASILEFDVLTVILMLAITLGFFITEKFSTAHPRHGAGAAHPGSSRRAGHGRADLPAVGQLHRAGQPAAADVGHGRRGAVRDDHRPQFREEGRSVVRVRLQRPRSQDEDRHRRPAAGHLGAQGRPGAPVGDPAERTRQTGRDGRRRDGASDRDAERAGPPAGRQDRRPVHRVGAAVRPADLGAQASGDHQAGRDRGQGPFPACLRHAQPAVVEGQAISVLPALPLSHRGPAHLRARSHPYRGVVGPHRETDRPTAVASSSP